MRIWSIVSGTIIFSKKSHGVLIRNQLLELHREMEVTCTSKDDRLYIVSFLYSLGNEEASRLVMDFINNLQALDKHARVDLQASVRYVV